jgi:peptidoglycan/xylan/chitin deacetylase (PgdA/CDA1 family)
MRGLPKFRRVLYRLLYFLRVPQFARFWNRRNVMILCYHDITERVGPDPDDRSGISVGRGLFVTQLRYLKQNYKVIALRDYLVARRRGQAVPPHSVVLTFDDGHRNFLTVAAPILRELEMPASVFLVTDRVDARDESNLGSTWVPLDDQVSLSWAETNVLRFAQAVDFGSHTCSHPTLPKLSPSELVRELQDSLYALAKNLSDGFIPSLAYPFGHHSKWVAKKVLSVGYSCALTTDAGSNAVDADLFRLSRAVVRRDDTVEVFAARVSGLVGWLRMSLDFLQNFVFLKLITKMQRRSP